MEGGSRPIGLRAEGAQSHWYFWYFCASHSLRPTGGQHGWACCVQSVVKDSQPISAHTRLQGGRSPWEEVSSAPHSHAEPVPTWWAQGPGGHAYNMARRAAESCLSNADGPCTPIASLQLNVPPTRVPLKAQGTALGGTYRPRRQAGPWWCRRSDPSCRHNVLSAVRSSSEAGCCPGPG